MWMTIDETALYLKVSKETIYRLAQKGDIPASKLGNQWRFNKTFVDEWMANKDVQQSKVKIHAANVKKKMIRNKIQ